MTIAEFCSRHNLTREEKTALAYLLAAMRAEKIFAQFGVNSLKHKYSYTESKAESSNTVPGDGK